MALTWRSMLGWMGGAALATAVVLLVTVLYPIIVKVCRKSNKPRSGTLEVLSGSNDAKFEIIAVHGLGANPHLTWTQAVPTDTIDSTQETKGTKSQPAKHPRRIHLLRDLLGRDFPEARILSFAYNSNWLTDAPVKTTEEIGKRLLEEITAKRSPRHLPIVFIGHSLGGIIIKQALCGENSEAIINDTSGIIFLGTPHQGSSVSATAAVLTAVTGFLGSDITLLLSLRSHESQLSNLTHSFRSRMAPNEHRRQKATIISFYETKPMYLLGWLSLGLVVSRDSAVVHADKEHSIDTDHSGLNKCAGSEDPLYAQLKEAIGSLRTPSRLEQADALIRNEHYNANRLKIERLSGAKLPMDQCYINLAIVEKTSQGTDVPKKDDITTSPFSLLARQKVETPDQTIQVELATIFNQRKRRDGRTVQPRRILIRGRAGVGKTTLCKKIVYEFTNGTWSDWSKLFDRILWLPLRNLKLEERCLVPGYNFTQLFQHEYFSRLDDRLDLAKALSNALKTGRNRTLFLLDGLDEVAQDLDVNSDMFRFFEKLLDQPNVIITSRPNANLPASLQDLDLELETIGFYPDQVTAYLNTDPKIKPKANEVQSFLQEHWLIHSLVRIPIQLDAHCYTWEDLDSGTQPDNMTGIYKVIEQKLWKKDVLQLEKRHDGKRVTPSQMGIDVKDLVQHEISFLKGFAFTGLHNNVMDFTPQHQRAISKQFKHPGILLDKTLPRLSFLRTSDASLEGCNCNYHFLHPTFEEYFAAQYFVQQWTSGEELLMLKLDSRQRKSNMKDIPKISAEDFLRKEKYNARYDTFWRFAAGLLDSEGQASRFIDVIDEEPLDLLGPTHQRLIIHCLSEISSDLPIRTALEERLSNWVLFECKFRGRSELASEIELLPQAKDKVFQRASTGVKRSLLGSLKIRGIRPETPPRVIDLAASWLRNNVDRPLRLAVQGMLQRQDSALPVGILKEVMGQLEDKSEHDRRAVAVEVGRQPTFSEEILKAMAGWLEHQDLDTNWAAIESVRAQSALPEMFLRSLAIRLDDISKAATDVLVGERVLPLETIKAVTARLEDLDEDIRWAAANTLREQSVLPKEIIKAIVARFKHSERDVRWAAIDALRSQAALPLDALGAVVVLLDDPDGYVRHTAINVIGEQSAPPLKITKAVAKALGDPEVNVRCAAIDALQSQSAVPEEVLKEVMARLEDQDGVIKREAIDSLGGQTNLPKEVLEALVTRLVDEDRHVRRAAIEALGHQLAFPEAVLKALAARLEDRDGSVRQAAADSLRSQTTLPEDVLDTLAGRLEDEDWGVLRAAVEALCWQPALPDKILKAMAAQLDHEGWDIRRATVEALRRRLDLPDEILGVVAARLEHKNRDVRWAAIEALSQQSALPDDIIKAIAARLEDEDWGVLKAAVEALGWRSALPDEILKAAAVLVEHKSRDVRWAAIEALSRRLDLPHEALKVVVARLRHKDRSVREAAVDVLGRRSNLPNKILKVVSERLKDEDGDVRLAAVKALSRRSDLPDEILKVVVAQLKDEDGNARRAAIEALSRQPALPDDILEAVAEGFEDEDGNVRRAAIEALSRQPVLPDDILKAVARGVEDTDGSVRWAAADGLVRRPTLNLDILNLHIKSLYRVLLERSFEEHLSWFVADRISYLAVGHRLVPLKGQHDRYRDAIRETQEDLGIPLLTTPAM